MCVHKHPQIQIHFETEQTDEGTYKNTQKQINMQTYHALSSISINDPVQSISHDPKKVQ